jgi:methylmalonyl-CoA mutase C-terminal domain/subunit
VFHNNRRAKASMKKKTRVLIARLGMDAHWRGSIVVARALRDAGMEVIYIGNQMPQNIVETAIQEDADVIGLSTLSGNHMILAPEVVTALREKGVEEKVVLLGGTIPPDDILKLKKAGIKEVFGPGTLLKEIIKFVSGISL